MGVTGVADVFIGLITGGVGAAVVAGVFKLLEHRVKRNDDREDAAENRQFQCAARAKEIEALSAKMDGVEAKQGALLSATKFLMYTQIRDSCEMYIDRGEITFTELEVLTDMHDCYHNELDGNGFLDELMEAVHKNVKVIPDRRA